MFDSTVSPLPQASYIILFIFIAEMCVVTISTLRTIFIARGMKILAPILGFFEVSIWLFAIGEVMKNLSDVRCSLAFAGGFTLGNYLGILIEQRLALGSVVVRSITARNAQPLVRSLQQAGYGVTCLSGHGAMGAVEIVFSIVPRRELSQVITILKDFDPEVFYSVTALQTTKSAAWTARQRRLPSVLPSFLSAPMRVLTRYGANGQAQGEPGA